jgi:hypothetical protein
MRRNRHRFGAAFSECPIARNVAACLCLLLLSARELQIESSILEPQ